MDAKKINQIVLTAIKVVTVLVVALLIVIIAYIIGGFVAGLVTLVAFVVTGAALVMFKQRRGLHSKKVDRGVFVYASSKRL